MGDIDTAAECLIQRETSANAEKILVVIALGSLNCSNFDFLYDILVQTSIFGTILFKRLTV